MLPAASRVWRSVPRTASVPNNCASAPAEPAALPEPVPLAVTELSGVSSVWLSAPVADPVPEPLALACPVRGLTDLVAVAVVAAVTLVFVTDPIEPIGMLIGAGIFGSVGIGDPPKMPPPPRIWALAGLAMAISAAAVVYRMVFMAWVLFN